MLQAAANCAGTQLHILPGNYAGKETGSGFFLFFPGRSQCLKTPESTTPKLKFCTELGCGEGVVGLFGVFLMLQQVLRSDPISQQRLAEPPGSSGSWIPIKNIPRIEAFPRWFPETRSELAQLVLVLVVILKPLSASI